MKLSSPAFAAGGSIPSVYTCDGANSHPPLVFDGVPAEAKSLVLIMDDPDVPKDLVPSGVYDHWVVFNIPPKTTGVAEGSESPGTLGANGAGQPAYTGPCPPDREHRYFFRLYALDTQLALKKGATKDEVLAAIDGHVISKAELMAKYARPGQR
ncbi:MAG: YbhB/YbcL family Raf kinase inhibitor-like protein [Patescibacteria group bacterium]|nr:YbhB/YbcL family Raf kinase inhibitor-like protein [Patescibacteria group bacterium]MDE2116873.1 YbhB/YbcL family Raf kinase inhibitor-like protein [Patescibacteria group bacterium]